MMWFVCFYYGIQLIVSNYNSQLLIKLSSFVLEEDKNEAQRAL